MSPPDGIEHNLGQITQIPPGEGRNFRIGETIVAVFRTHTDDIYATQPACPHRQGPLADGLLGGTTLICPLHDRAWDLRTGQAVGGASANEVCDLAVHPAWVLPDRSFVVILP